MSWLHILIFTPFIVALVVPLLYKQFVHRIHTGWFALGVPILIFLYLLSYIPAISQGNTLIFTLAWIPSLDINLVFYVDGLSVTFGLIITGIGALVTLYSIFYLSKEHEALNNFYVYLLLFMGSMLGLVFSDNIFVLYAFWELTTIASFLLIAFWFEREKSRYGALKSLVITILGGLSMLAGFIMLAMVTDTHSIRAMVASADLITAHYYLFIPAMALILLGAFTKSAQFPFSIWLPDAMEAPTPISAYLHSATMVKAGIYLVARLTPIFGGTWEWFWIISVTGLITLLYGSYNAVRQTDLKALLAYSTISQLGLIMSLLGMGSVAIYYGTGNEGALYALASFAAIFHTVNHAVFKCCLFMVVGIIDHETGTRDVRRLGGLMQLMPVSFTLMAVGSFSMAGLPPLNGFLSKEMFFEAAVNAAQMSIFSMESIGVLFPIVAWLASVFTFIYCLILVIKTFCGRYKSENFDRPVREASVGMLIAPLVLAGLVILMFFFPNTLSQYLLHPAWVAIQPALAQAGELNVNIAFWHGFTPALGITIAVIALGIILYVYLPKWSKIYNYYPRAYTLNNIYDQLLKRLENGSRWLTNAYMTGSVRHYLIYVFSFTIIIIGASLWLFDGVAFDFSGDAPVTVYEVVLTVAILLAALTVLFSNSRLVSLVANCTVGFLVSLFFVLFRAPDLALTQLVVETISTVLFLLCFYYLPKLKKEFAGVKFELTNALVALGVGATVTIMALSVQSTRLFPSISSYFENSYELTGAKNIVNAILVDFRGFDTMLEILVLFMAGLGVYALIKLRLSGGKENEEIK
ncbi:MAG: Na+/H+ antiporter subunit A [Syntrophaceticus sp.]|nr:Na+/H+ antiporter subunit A [Syntrophaceticus sp.]